MITVCHLTNPRRRGSRPWVGASAAAAVLVGASACAPTPTAPDGRPLAEQVAALERRVEQLSTELAATKGALEAEKTRVAEMEQQWAEQLAPIVRQTGELTAFTDALLGRVRDETGAIRQDLSQNAVRLDKLQFEFSRQFEDVEGRVSRIALAGQDQAQEMEAMRATMRRILEQESQPPRLLRSEPPVYPRALRREGVDGEVELVFIVDMAGNVVDPRVVRSNHPLFSEAALNAVQKWRFNAALESGRPVNAYVTQIISFRLKE